MSRFSAMIDDQVRVHYLAVPTMAVLRLDHRIRFYLWKACAQADLNPGALLKTRELMRTTYGALLKLTQREMLEDPPLGLPPIQGPLLDYARTSATTTPTPEVLRYFKQILLHAEHRLFGGQPNLRDLQNDARYLVMQDWQSKLRPGLGASVEPFSLDLVSFKPPPHGGEEVAPSSYMECSLDCYEHMRDVYLLSAEHFAQDGGFQPPVERSLLPLYEFEMPHLQEMVETHLRRAKRGIHYPPFDCFPDYKWSGYGETDDEEEEDELSTASSAMFSSSEISSDEDEDYTWEPYGENEEEAVATVFQGVVQMPLLLVIHCMRKRHMPMLGKQRLREMELAVMRAIGSKERRFEYMDLKSASPVLPAAHEARQLLSSPVQLTWNEVIVDMPRAVARILFAIAIDDVFEGDKKMQAAAEAVAKANAVAPSWRANCIGRNVTCASDGKLRVRDGKEGELKRMLRLVARRRDRGELPPSCARELIPLYDFAMRVLYNRVVMLDWLCS